MAVFKRREVKKVRHEYVIPVGSANWAEISKAFDAARGDMPEDKRGWDDSVWVEGNEENIIIYWEE